MKSRILFISLACLLGLGGVAFADAGDHMVRTRLIFISPDDSMEFAPEVEANPEDDVLVDGDVTVEVDYSYFFTDNWAMEAMLATASQPVDLKISAFLDAPTLEIPLGSLSHAPLTVMAQYHFNSAGSIRPYVGAGVNWTLFYEENLFFFEGGTLEADSSSFGGAAQVGVDFAINDRISFNLDLKYVQIETDVEAVPLDPEMGESLNVGTVEINPWIFGAGFGWKF